MFDFTITMILWFGATGKCLAALLLTSCLTLEEVLDGFLQEGDGGT